MSGPSHILDLPKEIQTKILSHLGLRSQINARKTCTLWSDLTNTPSVRSGRYSRLVSKNHGYYSKGSRLHKFFLSKNTVFEIYLNVGNGKIEKFLFGNEKHGASGDDRINNITNCPFLDDPVLDWGYPGCGSEWFRNNRRAHELKLKDSREQGKATPSHQWLDMWLLAGARVDDIDYESENREILRVYSGSASDIHPDSPALDFLEEHKQQDRGLSLANYDKGILQGKRVQPLFHGDKVLTIRELLEAFVLLFKTDFDEKRIICGGERFTYDEDQDDMVERSCICHSKRTYEDIKSLGHKSMVAIQFNHGYDQGIIELYDYWSIDSYANLVPIHLPRSNE